MSQGLLGSYSLGWFLLQQKAQQLKCLGCYLFILLPAHVDIGSPVLCQYLVVGSAWERTLSEEKHMENESQTIQVADRWILSFHVLYVDDFRRHVARRATPDKKIGLDIGELCQAKICDDAIPFVLLPKQQVLWLQISVHDALRVHLPEPAQDPMHNDSDLLGLELVLGLDFVVQMASWQKLEDNVQGVLGLEDLVEFHGVIVVEAPHHLNLFDQALFTVFLTVSALFRECFNSIVAVIL